MLFTIFITFILGYLIGSFQTSYLLIRLVKKQDVRQFGYGNAGASNTVASFGWKYGVIVALVDILKSIISVGVLQFLISKHWILDTNYLILLNGFAVILGHNYPFYLNFKGGKGTASLIGLIFAMNPWYGVISLTIIAITSIVSNYIVIGTVFLIIYFVSLVAYLKLGWISYFLAILIGIQSLYLHTPNFKRMQNKTETTIREKLIFKK